MKKEKSIEVVIQPKISNNTQETKTLIEIANEKQSLMDVLVKQTDLFALESLNKKRESENSKIKFLLKGKEISLEEIMELVVAVALPYSPKFPNDVPFYKEIYRLNKWDDLDPNAFTKPASVAKLTNAIIYRRFPKDVLPSIQVLNNYLPGCWIRGYKNFQFLNEEGQKQVEIFRDEAISIMKTCNTMHEFRIKMAQVYHVPYAYQKNLFEEFKD